MKPKMTMTLTKEQIEEALTIYCKDQLGKIVKGKIEFNVTQMPQPSGYVNWALKECKFDFEDTVEYKPEEKAVHHSENSRFKLEE